MNIKGETLYDQIMGGYRPDELTLNQIEELIHATFDNPRASHHIDLIGRTEKLLRELIYRGQLHARDIGEFTAERVLPRIPHVKGAPWRYLPWVNQHTGIETRYAVRREDVAKIANRLDGGEAFLKWVTGYADPKIEDRRKEYISNHPRTCKTWILQMWDVVIEENPDTASPSAKQVYDVLEANRTKYPGQFPTLRTVDTALSKLRNSLGLL